MSRFPQPKFNDPKGVIGMRKTVLLAAFACIFILTSLGIPYAKAHEPTKENVDFVTEFSCGYIIGKVLTHCVYCETLPPFCVSDKQQVFLKNTINNKDKVLSSSSPEYPGEEYTLLDKEKVKGKQILQYLIVEINCLKEPTNGKYYVELNYYNGGNCEKCEYSELYDDHGRLIATDRHKFFYKPASVKFNKILKEYESKYEKLKLQKVKNFKIKQCKEDKT